MRKIHVIVNGANEDHHVESRGLSEDEAAKHLDEIGASLGKPHIVRLDWLKVRADRIVAAYLVEG